MSNAQQYYEENEAFKLYVDKYCNQYELTVEEACNHMMVNNVMVYYKAEYGG